MFLKDGYKKIMLLTGTRISNIDLVNKGRWSENNDSDWFNKRL